MSDTQQKPAPASQAPPEAPTPQNTPSPQGMIGSIVGAAEVIVGDTVGGDSVGGDKVAGDKVSITNTFRDEDATPPPRPPSPSKDYVGRVDDEQRLSAALLGAPDDNPVLVVYGAPGTGKSSVARAVINTAPLPDYFGGGVLWGDLTLYTPEQLAREFLAQVKPRWLRDADGQTNPFELLWQALAARPHLPTQRSLIVLDKVSNWEHVRLFQPWRSTEHRILALASKRFEGRDLRIHEQCSVREFSEQEALDLFAKILGERYKGQENYFKDIALLCGFLPELVSLAARRLAEGKETPRAYLRRLQEDPGAVIGGDYRQNVLLVLQELPADQRDLLEYSGLLGNGPWTAEMLAAVALRPVEALRSQVESLYRLGLLDSDESGLRFRTKTLFRELARERIKANELYRYRAAGHLLSRFCLDVAQDLQTTLANQPNLPSPSDGSVQPAFVEAFWATLQPDLKHFERVLELAEESHEWDLLRRFSYLPYAGLVQGLVAFSTSVRADLIMATLDAPLIVGRRLSRLTPLAAASHRSEQRLVCSAPPWRAAAALRAFVGRELALLDGQTEARRLLERAGQELCALDGLRGDGCEIHLNLVAGHIPQGTFCGLDAVDASWTGVRAERILFCDVDLVNAQLLGCDMRCALWVSCDARRAALVGTNLSFALLRDVTLRGADLTSADLRGAQLERVDLRGADLTGADLRGAYLTDVNLLGARLDNVRWTGARREGGLIDPLLEAEVAALCQKELPAPLFSPYRGSLFGTLRSPTLYEPHPQYVGDSRRVRPVPPSASLPGATEPSWTLDDADLRRVRLEGEDFAHVLASRADLRLAEGHRATLANAVLTGADLRLALLYEATLTGVTLGHADLAGADLYRASLHQCYLDAARLVGADLSDALVEGGSMVRADLRLATLSGATLRDLSMEGCLLVGALLDGCTFARVALGRVSCESASLRQAVFDAECTLNDAVLDHADLEQASLAELTLQGASLRGTNLKGANLRGAQLLNADLREAVLVEADLTGANLTGARLRGAQMAGATLTDVLLDGAELDA